MHLPPQKTPNISSAATEGELVGEDRLRELPPWAVFLTTKLPWLILLWLTLSFGGVHELNILTVQLLLSLVAIPVLYWAIRSTDLSAQKFPLSKLVTAGFFWLALCTPIFSGISANGPVGNSYSFLNRALSTAALTHLQFSLFLGISFILLRYGLLYRNRKGTAALCTIAVATAGIALVHWLTDNGKLFWYFEPKNEFISPRVRWPFVNPDHLAHFLIPGLFLLLGQLKTSLSSLADFAQNYQPARKHKLAHLFSSQRFQQRLTNFVALAVGTLLVALAIGGSLSRAAWLATSIGVLALLIFDYCIIPARTITETTKHPISAPLRTPNHAAKNSRKIARAVSWEHIRRWARPALLGAALLIFFFFLNERGRDLLADRLEYGLLHSKDDIRWQMYRDTMPAISEHLWFGVGLGNWEHYFRHSMDPLLAGVNPVYLHSDPLQLLAETGLVGVLPLLTLWLYGTLLVMRKIRELPRDRAVRLAAALIAVWCALVASCFDFPFRMPAISLQFTLLLALLCAKSEDIPSVDAEVLRKMPAAGESAETLAE